VGKRSRTLTRRRRRKKLLEKLTSILAERELHVLEFCRMAAEFADRRAFEGSGATTAVQWLTEHCHMTEQDAAESIAIGRRLMSEGGRNLSA
jgi:hypothetical protein